MCHYYPHREGWDGDDYGAGAVDAAGLTCCWMVSGAASPG